MLRAHDVAEWFIHWAAADEEPSDLTNMKLQKLLYYAQGHHLGRYGVPLFSEKIEAWSHGPVVSDVYHRYKTARSGEVKSRDSRFSWDNFTPQQHEFLSMVWNTYGGFTAARLRNMTHAEAPWKKNFNDAELHKEIPAADIVEYFGRSYK